MRLGRFKSGSRSRRRVLRVETIIKTKGLIIEKITRG